MLLLPFSLSSHWEMSSPSDVSHNGIHLSHSYGSDQYLLPYTILISPYILSGNSLRAGSICASLCHICDSAENNDLNIVCARIFTEWMVCIYGTVNNTYKVYHVPLGYKQEPQDTCSKYLAWELRKYSDTSGTKTVNIKTKNKQKKGQYYSPSE